MKGKGEQGFPEAAQEVLDDTTDDVDVTDLVQLRVTTSAKETVTKLLDSLVVTGKRADKIRHIHNGVIAHRASSIRISSIRSWRMEGVHTKDYASM